MSLLCDIFVASQKDALLYPEFVVENHDAVVPPRFVTVSLSGLTPDAFANLAETIHEDRNTRALRHIAHEESGEWWLEEFASEFVLHLERLSDSEIQMMAAKWADNDECVGDQEDAKTILRNLRRLAGIAGSTKRPMYLWGSV
jgi:hypothetical protein